MHDAKTWQVPMLFVRFEDLILDPEPELRNIMKFLLDLPDLSGTNAERRVKEVLALGRQATKIYSLKDNTERMNANTKRYTAG